MDYTDYIYIASCVFTKNYPELSMRIQEYLKKRFNMKIIRCCVPDYKIQEFENSMPECVRAEWKSLPSYDKFTQNNRMVYICHNCSAIFLETMPDVKIISLWEIILEDKKFQYPDYFHENITVQDCWRSYDNRVEQEAVRTLLNKMNIDVVEMEQNYDKTQFCGVSIYQPSPKRNLNLAPRRFIENAAGKFISRTGEEKVELMRKHGQEIITDKVVAYCHYCAEGLQLGGKDVKHLAELLFPAER
ncbi:MAG: hypothetical protein CXR31_05310 [Geobacter sp.]|nr:MAG: hypothetical protein CXR31_05310 [Geobacter sp.]